MDILFHRHSVDIFTVDLKKIAFKSTIPVIPQVSLICRLIYAVIRKNKSCPTIIQLLSEILLNSEEWEVSEGNRNHYSKGVIIHSEPMGVELKAMNPLEGKVCTYPMNRDGFSRP